MSDLEVTPNSTDNVASTTTTDSQQTGSSPSHTQVAPLDQFFELLSNGVEKVYAALDVTALKLYATKVDDSFFTAEEKQQFNQILQSISSMMLSGEMVDESATATAIKSWVAKLCSPTEGLNQTKYLAKLAVIFYNAVSRQLLLKLNKSPPSLFQGISGVVAQEIEKLRKEWQQQQDSLDVTAVDDTPEPSSTEQDTSDDAPPRKRSRSSAAETTIDDQ